ncbi:hypothetical protein D9I37_20475 [Escherichia coli]|nr:hypothetical protein [Escherichia coli]
MLSSRLGSIRALSSLGIRTQVLNFPIQANVNNVDALYQEVYILNKETLSIKKRQPRLYKEKTDA